MIQSVFGVYTRANIHTRKQVEELLENLGQLDKFKICCYVIKELYFSSYKAYLQTLTNETLMSIYLKTEKYIYEERNRNNTRFYKLFHKMSI